VISKVLANTKYLYCLVALLATLPRVLFIVLFPESAGDGAAYARVADNILSGCGVSLSIIGSGECIPHFGGNQGPGYPAFIAGVWWVSGHSDLAVRLVQGLAFVVSLVYLVDAIHRYTSSAKQALVVGLVLALSPLQVAWPRFFLTETLALVGTLWLFAELIKSLHESKLRVVPIGIALIMATFIRLDAVLLLIPVSIAGFIIHRPVDAIQRGLVIGLILALPWSGWLLRNVNVGLPNVFSPLTVELNKAAGGLYAWQKTWATNVYSSIAIDYPVAGLNYDTIRVDEGAYRTNEEKEKVKILLEELKLHTNKAIPKHINDQFAGLAAERIKADPLNYFLFNPVKRMWALWSNINAGLGWPGLGNRLSAEDRIDIANGGTGLKLLLLKKYPILVMGKILVNGWKILLYFLFTFAVWLSFKDKKCPHRDIMVLTLSFILTRSIFSGWMNLTEPRFSVMQMPVMELVTVLVLTHAILGWKNSKSSLIN
jgi:hypothetical protein